jgi:uncharacterized protein (DUF1501 family)
MNRRGFLQLGGGGFLSVLASSAWLRSLAGQGPTAVGSGKVLVWLELRGGNDGINTVIPFRDRLYQKARPSLAISDGPALNRDLILHPALAPLQPLWQARRLAIALGVGWPQPNRSHFRAMDQWATANPSGDGIGWLAAGLDRQRRSGPLVALGPSGSRGIEGGKSPSLQMAPAQLAAAADSDLDPSRAGNNPVLRKILELNQTGHRELVRLRDGLAPLPNGVTLPRSAIGQQVGLALRLIGARQAPPVLQMAHGGFDTHASQATRQARALEELADALAVFDKGLAALPRRPQVTVLVTSEFGRRLQENQSGGTDHGSASVALLLGDHLPDPILGAYPSLDRLDDRGDLTPTLAPTRLYEKVLAL